MSVPALAYPPPTSLRVDDFVHLEDGSDVVIEQIEGYTCAGRDWDGARIFALRDVITVWYNLADDEPQPQSSTGVENSG